MKGYEFTHVKLRDTIAVGQTERLIRDVRCNALDATAVAAQAPPMPLNWNFPAMIGQKTGRQVIPIRREQCAKRDSRKSKWSRSCARRIASRYRSWPSGMSPGRAASLLLGRGRKRPAGRTRYGPTISCSTAVPAAAQVSDGDRRAHQGGTGNRCRWAYPLATRDRSPGAPGQRAGRTGLPAREHKV